MIASVFVTALITFGLAYTQARLEGPLGVNATLREWGKQPKRPLWIQDGIDCPFCLSFWAAIPAALIVGGSPHDLLLQWLAGFGLAVFAFLFVKI